VPAPPPAPGGGTPRAAAHTNTPTSTPAGAPSERSETRATEPQGGPVSAAAPAASAHGSPRPDASAIGGVQAAARTVPGAAIAGTESVEGATGPAPVAEQVLDAVLPLRNHADGDYQVRLELRPAELGRVELSVELRDGVLSVHMHADNAAARDVLQQQLARMRDLLHERGVRTGSLDVGDHSLRHETRAAPRDRGEQANGDATRGRSADDGAQARDERVVVLDRAPTTTDDLSSGRLDLHV
jgi:flagellar hook-length control protein FliK